MDPNQWLPFARKGLRRLFLRGGPSRLEQQIHALLEAGAGQGWIDPASGDMIERILSFRQTVVREVMVPRTEMVAIPVDAPIGEILSLVIRHGHTRLPVYREGIDNVIGILNVKDLLKFWSRPVTEKEIVSLLRQAYFIPESKNTLLLLHELKQKKHHVAIVIDEYGGTSGLVTLEDLVEEIVGEIHDEHDVSGGMVTLPDGSVLADGRTEIEQIEEHFGVTFPPGRYETLAGLILHAVRRIPATGEIFRIEGFDMAIQAAGERSIQTVRLKRVEERHGHAS